MNKLLKSNRIVVKIGSSLLVEKSSGLVNKTWLSSLAKDVAELKESGKDILIVSSGAIALGRRYLGLSSDILKLEESQAAAAAGQSILVYSYKEFLTPYELKIAQVLLTLDDTEQRRKYLNARNTIEMLLKLNVIPIINENDTVATAEIRFGDNDRLSSRVASMISADCLILLSDVDGLYTSNPNTDKNSKFIKSVETIDKEIELMAGSASIDGTGGMITKLLAAKTSTAAGCNTVIARGSINRPISAILEGKKATWFSAHGTPKTARKQWIASSLKPLGSIVIDEGAKKALLDGKSLLPAGVVDIKGSFQRGDPIIIKDLDGNNLAQGLVAYSTEDARLISGHKSAEIENLLGYRGRDEIIHRDDLALII